MKKINYLFALIATVFVLGMTSCDTSNDPTPDNTVDGIQLSDFDGVWETVSVTYKNVDYTANEVCVEVKDTDWERTDFNIMSSVSKIIFTDVCRNFDRNWDVTFNTETLVITNNGSTGGVREWKIVEYDLTNNTASIQVITDTFNAAGTGLPVGIVYHVEKQ